MNMGLYGKIFRPFFELNGGKNAVTLEINHNSRIPVFGLYEAHGKTMLFCVVSPFIRTS